MTSGVLYTDALLDPISAEQPVGSDLRWTAEWDRIKEARRADDDLESGKWAKKEHKSADWRLVEELASSMLRGRSKDLQLALWLTEAGMKLHGFPGLRDGLRVARELLVRYWDSGLFPPIEDGPEDRAGPFEWLNNKLVDSVISIPITARRDGGVDYSLLDLHDARATGSEAQCKGADGEIDSAKKKAYDTALVQGHISLDMFDRAVSASARAACEALYAEVQQTLEEFHALEKTIDGRFGDAAPNLSICRNILQDIEREMSIILEKKRREEPNAIPLDTSTIGVAASQGNTRALSLTFAEGLGVDGPLDGSWHEAESLIHSGDVDKGLAQMIRLAAQETSGRNRFQRKLLLAEACLASRRDRLARSILEELAEQIDKVQLEIWESSALIAGVWIPLYKLYKQGADASDQERAGKLYDRMCRLDPWQALSCGDE